MFFIENVITNKIGDFISLKTLHMNQGVDGVTRTKSFLLMSLHVAEFRSELVQPFDSTSDLIRHVS